MTLLQRIKRIFSALLMYVGILVLLLIPDDGYLIILLMFGLSIILAGIRYLIFYFSMAKHMVGGKAILYRGVLELDFGSFTLTLADIQKEYVMVYLLVLCGFYGFIQIMRALEVKHLDNPSWKFKFTEGIIYLVFAIIGVIFIGSAQVATYIYCTGIFFSATTKLLSAFKRTAIVYIQ